MFFRSIEKVFKIEEMKTDIDKRLTVIEKRMESKYYKNSNSADGILQ